MHHLKKVIGSGSDTMRLGSNPSEFTIVPVPVSGKGPGEGQWEEVDK